MIVYVAGASAELERAQQVMEWVRSEGWTVAHDWVADVVRERIEGGRSDAELTRYEKARYAVADLNALRGSDVFWLLAPEKPTTGAWVELGSAYAKEMRLVVSGPAWDTHLFSALAQDSYETDLAALEAITHIHTGE